jgi:hypothetical protein
MPAYKVSFAIEGNQKVFDDVIFRRVEFTDIEKRVKDYLKKEYAIVAEPLILRAEIFNTEIF